MEAEKIGIGALVEMIVKRLVDNADKVKVNEVKGDYTMVIEVSVAKEDMGRFIGKKGVNAQAIRTLLMAMSGKDRKSYQLEIND